MIHSLKWDSSFRWISALRQSTHTVLHASVWSWPVKEQWSVQKTHTSPLWPVWPLPFCPHSPGWQHKGDREENSSEIVQHVKHCFTYLQPPSPHLSVVYMCLLCIPAQLECIKVNYPSISILASLQRRLHWTCPGATVGLRDFFDDRYNTLELGERWMHPAEAKGQRMAHVLGYVKVKSLVCRNHYMPNTFANGVLHTSPAVTTVFSCYAITQLGLISLKLLDDGYLPG